MADTTADQAAVIEIVAFLHHVKDLKDPRQQGRVAYQGYRT